MQFGMFMQPSHPPEVSIYDGIQQDLQIIEWLDELGYSEVWIGEHLTVPWEPTPACDLIMAQALQRTKDIKICSGAYMLPFYHPAELALRILQFDHMAQGRFICGVAAGFSPTDVELLGLDFMATTNRDMMRESLEIMVKMWTEHVGEEWTYEGQFWTVHNSPPIMAYGPHMEPFQRPHPPIAVAGLSPRSDTIRFAGEHGYIPLSLTFNATYLKDHWTVYEEGAATTGAKTDRNDWRVVRDIFVAETDAEAKDWVRNGNHAAHWVHENLPTCAAVGWTEFLKHDPSVADEDVDVDYLVDNLWLVGSPETVTEKLLETQEVLGGFGTIIVNKYDYGDTPDAYRRSLELFATEVVPNANKVLA